MFTYFVRLYCFLRRQLLRPKTKAFGKDGIESEYTGDDSKELEAMSDLAAVEG